MPEAQGKRAGGAFGKQVVGEKFNEFWRGATKGRDQGVEGVIRGNRKAGSIACNAKKGARPARAYFTTKQDSK